MSSLTNQYLEELEVAKQDIKTALEEKGVSPTGGYTSYAEAIDDIYIPKIQEYVTKDINENGSYWIHTDSGYDAVEEVKVNVEVLPDLQSKSVTITENKTEIIKCDNGYDGLNEVEVNVDVYVPTFETQDKTITITKNGTRSVFPDTGYDGLSSVEITVDVASSGGGGGESKPQIPNGFRFTGGDLAQVDFGAYDWSMVYDTSHFFKDCTHSTGDWSNFNDNFNGKIMCCDNMFGDSTKSRNWTTIPNIDTSEAVSMSEMFRGCQQITTIPEFDTSNVMDMSYMFYDCYKLPAVPNLDTSNVLNMSYMFYNCDSLLEVSMTNTQNVINMMGMLQNCTKLTTVNLPNTQNVRNMGGLFKYCDVLVTVENLDMSKVINAYEMFSECESLINLPNLNTTPNLRNTSRMFSNCYGLTNIPSLELSGVTVCEYMFYNCRFTSIGDLNLSSCATMSEVLGRCFQLTTIGVIHCDSMINTSSFPSDSTLNAVTNIGGFRNLGKMSSLSNTNGSNSPMVKLPNLTYESVMNVLNELYDRASAGLSVVTLKLHANHLAMLSEDDIAIATNKGWTLV